MTQVIEVKKELTKVQRTKQIFENDDVKNKLREMLGKKAPGFISSVLSAMNSSDVLKNAEPNSVYMSAMMAASLDLPINANLGLAYIIPYNKKQPDGSYIQVAQFQVGYKGFIQLAIRSGQFLTISAAPIYEGQLIECDPLKGYVFDWNKKESDKIIGYASYFKLLNGMEKTLYMTVEELKGHGGKYSKTFGNKFGLWNTDFEAMARKTVIKLLLQRYAPLSIEMQKATISDQAVINDYEDLDSVSYIDNEPEVETDPLLDRVAQMIESASTREQLIQINDDIDGGIPEELGDQFVMKMDFLENKELESQEKPEKPKKK